MSADALWPLGVAIYVTGTVGEALGANLQRLSLTTEAELVALDPSHTPRRKFQQRLWTTGFFLFVSAGIFMSMALFFASQTVLAPLQLFLFVSNSIFANIINHENFCWIGWDGTALLFVIVGVTLTMIGAPKETQHYSNEELLWLMRQPGFISFCCVAGVFLITVWVTKRRILAACQHDPRNIRRRWIRTVLNMSYGAMAGAFGGVNVTMTKTVFSLLVGQFNEGGVVAILSSPVLWLVSIVLIGTWVLQIAVTVSGLEVTSAIIVISAHSVVEQVMATLGGVLYFQDYQRFSSEDWAFFVIGNTVAVVSVIGLSHLRLRDAEAKEEEQKRAQADKSECALVGLRERATSEGFVLCKHDYTLNKMSPIDETKIPHSEKHITIHEGDDDPELGMPAAHRIPMRKRYQSW